MKELFPSGHRRTIGQTDYRQMSFDDIMDLFVPDDELSTA